MSRWSTVTQLRPYSGMPSTSFSGPPAASVAPSMIRRTQSIGAIGPASPRLAEVVRHDADRVDVRSDRAVVVHPVAAVAFDGGIVEDRRHAHGEHPPVGVQPRAELGDEGHPVRSGRLPRVLAVREREVLVVDVDAVEVVARRRRPRSRRCGLALTRVGEDRRHSALAVVVEDRRDHGHAAFPGFVEELFGEFGVDAGIVDHRDRRRAGRLVPERRQLVERVGRGAELGAASGRAASGNAHVCTWNGPGSYAPCRCRGSRSTRCRRASSRSTAASAPRMRPRPATSRLRPAPPLARSAVRRPPDRVRAAEPGRSSSSIRRTARPRSVSVAYSGGGVDSTHSPRCSGVIPRSVSSITRCGAAGIGTTFCTATTTQPAASADAMPVGESSIATHDSGSTRSSSAARRYGSGCGLPFITMSPVMTVWNEPGGSCGHDDIGERLPRHRHEPARHAAQTQRGQQLAGARSPRDRTGGASR